MDSELAGEMVGWAAAAILLATVGRQVYSQWRSKTTKGLSKWLFVGQIAASVGFVVYSWIVANWVFVVTNVFMLLTAVVGQIIFLKNRAREEGKADDTAVAPQA